MLVKNTVVYINPTDVLGLGERAYDPDTGLEYTGDGYTQVKDLKPINTRNSGGTTGTKNELCLYIFQVSTPPFNTVEVFGQGFDPSVVSQIAVPFAIPEEWRKIQIEFLLMVVLNGSGDVKMQCDVIATDVPNNKITQLISSKTVHAMITGKNLFKWFTQTAVDVPVGTDSVTLRISRMSDDTKDTYPNGVDLTRIKITNLKYG